MKKLFHLLLVSVLLIFSCNKDSDIPQHSIDSVFPFNGMAGTSVIINGNGFSEVIAENVVTFNGKEAIVTSATTTRLEALLPTMAGTGTVDVTINGQRVTGPVFTYEYIFIVSTLAGTLGEWGIVDGIGNNAKFYDPDGLDLDEFGNIIVADGKALRKVTPAGSVTTIAGSNAHGDTDGFGPAAAFAAVEHTTVLEDGSYVVSQHQFADKLKKVTTGGSATTWIGDIAGYVNGPPGTALFDNPAGLDTDSEGNIFLADNGNNVIRKINPGGNVSTFAGSGTVGNDDGQAGSATFNKPFGLRVLPDDRVVVVDEGNHNIRMISPSGAVTTLAGSGTSGFQEGIGTSAIFDTPLDICIGHDGAFYVADSDNHRIRRIGSDGTTSTFAGGVQGYMNGSLGTARFNYLNSIIYDPVNYIYYISDYDNTLLRKIQVQ
ncbi:MAG: hypothetical protein GY751_03160 [Bacteroidetes bacterium]|nr:hypothetical protein [Bacteroidota bacterium]